MTKNLDEEMSPLSRKRKTNPSAAPAAADADSDKNNHRDEVNKNFQIPMPDHHPSSIENNDVTLTLSLQLHPPSRQCTDNNYSPAPPSTSPPPPPPQTPSISLQSLLSPQIPFPYLHLSPTSPPPPDTKITAAAAPQKLPPAPAAVHEPPPKKESPAPLQRVVSTRVRRNPTQAPRDGSKSEYIPPPYPWATNKRAIVHTLAYLETNNISTISGEVQCRRCEKQYKLDLDLKKKFLEIASYMVQNKSIMHDRAPVNLMNPVLPTCINCKQENSVKPVISEKKKTINWLFLLLGQMLGCCTLEQLKYFCKHTKNHRTGAKDRVLYLTYLAICKQLDPEGPFDR